MMQIILSMILYITLSNSVYNSVFVGCNQIQYDLGGVESGGNDSVQGGNDSVQDENDSVQGGNDSVCAIK